MKELNRSIKSKIMKFFCKYWQKWKYYVLTYENAKMRPVETILRRGGGR
jgi:hypothetical protein